MEILTIAFLSVIFLVFGVFFVNKVLSMIIEGEITPLQSVIFFFIFAFFVTLFFKVPANWFRIVIIVLVGGFDFTYEHIKKFINNEDNKNYYMRKIMECDEILLKNQNDWGTLSEKARCYFKMKDYEKAIEIQEKVVKISNNDLNEVGKLKSYIKYEYSVSNTDVKCWFCGAMVPKGIDKCYKCGRNMNFGLNIVEWLKKGGMKKIIVNVVGILLICFLYNVILSFMSQGLRFLIHLLTIIVIFGCIAYSIFRKD